MRESRESLRRLHAFNTAACKSLVSSKIRIFQKNFPFYFENQYHGQIFNTFLKIVNRVNNLTVQIYDFDIQNKKSKSFNSHKLSFNELEVVIVYEFISFLHQFDFYVSVL